MKHVTDLADSVAGIVQGAGKCERCGATTRLDNGCCVACLLKENFEVEVEASAQVFEGVLTEADVRDKGWRLGNYEILEEIGRGGMGVIYRARQRHSGRIVAVKRVLTYHADSHETLARFRREAEAAASLDHPNILPVYEVSETEQGLPFFSMKFAAGGNLRAAASGLRDKPRDCVRLMANVARAITYAHAQGILHRDLQPGNILLDARGAPLVSDFGLAKWLDEESDLTRTLTTFGTPGYISPEQAEGASFSPAADIYSLGAILFYLLAGRPPFVGANALSVIQQASATAAPKLRSFIPSLDRDLETIVARCLERDPKSRYQTAAALASDLEHWLEGRPIIARPVRAPARVWRWSRRNPKLIATGAACLLFGAATMLFFRGERAKMLPAAPEKSIAILPFENLSADKTNAFFADGLQDDILTKLAKIADLKVISRSSVMQYRGKQDLRRIGKALGVSHVLQGTVRRSNDKVHVNAQLVSTRSDTHVWAEEYYRDLNDVFAIEAEVARSIANRLQVKLSPREKSIIEQPTTSDIPAFDLYTRAHNLLLTATDSSTGGADRLQAIDLLNQAVTRDPSFFQAYCQLARAHDQLYFFGFDRTSTRLALADSAIRAASRLRPDAGETHFARARHLYWGYLDYNRALAELELALQTLPNDALVFQLIGFIQRRQGRWEESSRNMERAVELDPLNTFTLQQMAWHYLFLRRYSEVKPLLARVRAIEPNRVDTEALVASVDFHWKANIKPLHRLIDSIRVKNPSALSGLGDAWLTCALAERDADAAANAIVAMGGNAFGDDTVQFTRTFVEGLVARMMKDEDKARSAFTAARMEQEKVVQAQPDYGPPLCVLGLIDAALGRKEEALREGRRAVQLLPVEKDAINGTRMIKYLAMIAAWSGDKDLANDQLATALRYPTSPSYGDLKLLPFWDPLRGDPRFDKIIEESKQPVAPESMAGSVANKSIAVLPFENLSGDPDNAYFADGVRDEILTRLSKIADLKVISRTSTQHYKSAPENLPEIAKQLGVAHILEGSVQKSADAVRVNVQLIKAADDSHLWAETFDRKLTDIFSVENEVAMAIADQLRAKITGQEEQVIAAKPTDNPEAYDAYLRGLAYSLKTANTPANAVGAQKYLREAVRLDPKFALAWALLSYVDSRAWFSETLPPTAALREEARQAGETALALQPTLGEAILAKGRYHYDCLQDYDTAVQYFEQARQFLPNSSRIPASLAYVARRQGQWERSEAYFNEAERLDPRDVQLLTQHARSYISLRRFPEALRKLEQVLNITPDDVDTLTEKAAIAQGEGDLPRAGALLTPLRPNADSPALITQIYETILERRPEPAIRWLKGVLAEPDPALGYVSGVLRFYLGWAQEVGGDRVAAQESWRQARIELESFFKEQPDNFTLKGYLALTDMALGDKAAAFDLIEQAMAAFPVEKDAMGGPTKVEILARVAAHTGEHDRAIPLLQKLLSIPYEGAVTGTPLTPALLRLDPMFDPLRDDPRFQKLALGK